MQADFPQTHLRFERRQYVEAPEGWEQEQGLRAWLPNWMARAIARLLGGLG